MTRLQVTIADLNRRGVQLLADGEDLIIRAPRGTLTDQDREILKTRKQKILGVLRESRADDATPSPPTRESRSQPPTQKGDGEINSQYSRKSKSRRMRPISANSANKSSRTEAEHLDTDPEVRRDRTTTISGQAFEYSFWEGQPLSGDLIGFDTETALIVENEVPKLALASASSRSGHCLIHPDLVAKFIRVHSGRQFILHNCAFDFWVVREHLCGRRASKACEAWDSIVDQNRMHDTMLLDELIRLARSDAYPRPRNLAEVAREYAGLEIDKADPYRLRYGEIIGVDWSGVDDGFFGYAVKDALATRAAYEAMIPLAVNLMEKHGYDPARRT